MSKLFSTSLAVALMCLGCIIASCSKEESVSLEPLPEHNQEGATEEQMQNYYVNIFAYNEMNLYYLWVDEPQVQAKMSSWMLFDDPKKTIADIRFKDSAGKDIDRWTTMVDNYGETVSGFDGVGKTYGFDFQLYLYDEERTTICAVVTYVFKGGPAEQAGWKRGDVIVKVNGKTMPLANDAYKDIVMNELMAGSTLKATMADGKESILTSVTMQEDAVLLTKVFDCYDGKKVGYMMYNSFTFESIDRLIEECRKFKSEGIKELILDLRYNGGGYGLTNQALCSMLAPEDVVRSSAVFQTQVYNAKLTKVYKSSLETHFETEFKYKTGGIEKTSSTADANIGIDKLYVLITGNSASASEALITCLRPYMPVVLIGEQSYGKYCGGYLLGAQDFYDRYKDAEQIKEHYAEGRKAVEDWGIYVMVSRYADKDGTTGCMPDGFKPDVPVTEVPYSGHQLGDPDEEMLAVALAQAGYQHSAAARPLASGIVLGNLESPMQVRKRNFGLLILNNPLTRE